MSDLPEDVMREARRVVDPFLRKKGKLHAPELEHAIACAILDERVRSLEAAKSTIHCGCTNYCDFDEAEEKIDELLAAIRAP